MLRSMPRVQPFGFVVGQGIGDAPSGAVAPAQWPTTRNNPTTAPDAFVPLETTQQRLLTPFFARRGRTDWRGAPVALSKMLISGARGGCHL